MKNQKTETISMQLEQWIRSACILEATARKPGNVHPQASFADLCYDDFVASANVIAPILANTGKVGIGQTVLDAVTATQSTVGGNTNLGIVLLIAPLAAVPFDVSLEKGIQKVLQQLTYEDADLVYRAIRCANPGGMGQVAEGDLSQEPTGTLLEMMQIAANRDLVAAQYANGFEQVLNFGLPWLHAQQAGFTDDWEETVICLQLELMAAYPDSHISRKRGPAEAQAAASLARGVLDIGWPNSEEGPVAIRELDGWLRECDNQRNPGTTADLVTACLFAALREGSLQAPLLSAIQQR